MTQKLRILCLPGWRTSSKIMGIQLKFSLFESQLKDLVTFVPLDPTFQAEGRAQNVIYELDPEGPYYEWWYLRRKNSEVVDYEGLDESVEYVYNYILKHGPFDGLLGFSQGAALINYLVALQAQENSKLKSLFRFVILVAGFVPMDYRFMSLVEPPNHLLELPSLHIYGKEDFMVKFSMKSASFYKQPLIIEHSRGHSFPKLEGEYLKVLTLFLNSFASSIAPKL